MLGSGRTSTTIKTSVCTVHAPLLSVLSSWANLNSVSIVNSIIWKAFLRLRDPIPQRMKINLKDMGLQGRTRTCQHHAHIFECNGQDKGAAATYLYIYIYIHIYTCIVLACDCLELEPNTFKHILAVLVYRAHESSTMREVFCIEQLTEPRYTHFEKYIYEQQCQKLTPGCVVAFGLSLFV